MQQYTLLLQGIGISGRGLGTVEKPNKLEAETIALISKTMLLSTMLMKN